MFTIPGLALFKKFCGTLGNLLRITDWKGLNQGGPLLHSCGPLFKINRVCGPLPAKNTYFRPKIRVFSKKKKSSLGIGLQNSYFRPKIRVFSKKKKVFTWNRSPKFLFLSQNQGVL